MMKAKQYHISNLAGSDLNDKSHIIHSSISELEGVNAVRVDPFRSIVTVDFDDDKVSEKEIQNKLKENNFFQ